MARPDIFYMMRNFYLSAILAFAGSSAAIAASPVGIANVIGASSWESEQKPPYGMYSFAMGDSPEVRLVSDKVVPANFGGVYVDGRFFAIEGIATTSGSFITNYIYDAETWNKITDFRGENITAFDMVWDPVSDNVYGYFHNFDTNEEFFGTIDILTGKTSSIAKLPFTAYGLGCDVEGQLYAMSKTGDFYSVDKATGQSTKIASTPCSSAWTTSGAVDSSTRTFYYACCNDSETLLYGVSLDSGEAVRLQVIPDNMEMIGLYFEEPSALPKAPGRVENVLYEFNGPALEGTVSFTIPEYLNDGTPGVGEVDYTVDFNGVRVASAKASYGALISIPVSVDTAGEYPVRISLRNDVGSAPVCRESEWIGQDTPAQLESVSLVYDGSGTFTLSWPEATSQHDGWFDNATVSYIVKRYASDKEDSVDFTGITENSFTDKVSLPSEDEYATYHYSVAAVFGSVVGSYKSSEYYTIGSMEPPFSEQFDARWDLGKFTIFEGENKDYNRWSYDNKAVTLTTGGSSKADDYLLLPPLMLKHTNKYEISFDAKGKYASDVEKFEVLAGLAPTVGALDERVMETVEMKSNEYQKYTAEFIPAKDGAYFIGIHGVSDPYKGAITIDNIRVSAGVDSGIGGIPVNNADKEAEYYTLQGIRVSNPAAGIYIEVRGSDVRKVIIR